MDFSNVVKFFFGQGDQKCNPTILVGNVPPSKNLEILNLLENHCQLQPNILRILEHFERPNQSISVTVDCCNQSIFELVMEATSRKPLTIDGVIISVGPLHGSLSTSNSGEETDFDVSIVPGCEFDMEFPRLVPSCKVLKTDSTEKNDEEKFIDPQPTYKDLRLKAIKDIERTNGEMMEMIVSKRKNLSNIQSEIHNFELSRLELLKKQIEIDEKVRHIDQMLAQQRNMACAALLDLENLEFLRKQKVQVTTDEIRMLRMNHDPSLFEKLTKFEQCEEKIKDFSECSCCFENFTKMVFQCVRGHLICPDCHDQLDLCPQCRIRFEKPGIRSLVAEQLLGLGKT